MDSYIGSKISLISKSQVRYEGILHSISSEEATVALQNGKSQGSSHVRPWDINSSASIQSIRLVPPDILGYLAIFGLCSMEASYRYFSVYIDGRVWMDG